MTESNGDGNRDLGRYGEDYSDEAKQKEAELKKRIEELRKRDLFINDYNLRTNLYPNSNKVCTGCKRTVKETQIGQDIVQVNVNK